MSYGWIKIHRELLEKPIWESSTPEQKTILVTLMAMANHKEKTWEWKGEKYNAKPGQFVTSLPSIVQKSGKGISVQNVRTALKRFEKLEFLTDESTKQNRLITLLNWGLYQGNSDDVTDELTVNQQTTNSQLTSNKNVRMEECKKKDKDLSKSPTKKLSNDEDVKTFVAYATETLPKSLTYDLLFNYFNCIRKTRVSSEVTENVMLNLLKKLTDFTTNQLNYALYIHYKGHTEKSEKYTLGILRRTSDEEAITKLQQIKNGVGKKVTEERNDEYWSNLIKE